MFRLHDRLVIEDSNKVIYQIHALLSHDIQALRDRLALAEGVCWAADHWSAVHQGSGYGEISPEQRAFLEAFSAWKRMQQSDASVEESHLNPRSDDL